ncbi:MAG: M20/M25/M40 family metallo-hydrolase, partial [Ktedonobacteraceae bacterium]|nr:M20/M25/M40 family metallo-hydrolase [Ktedonobacteraceae bacterium]
TFLLEGEEEVGSPHLAEFAAANQELIKTDGCLWESGYRDAEGNVTLNAGAKGMLYVEMRTRGVGYDLHSSNAPIAPSAAWRLLEALRSLRDSSGHILIPHFYDDVRPPTEREAELLQRFPIDSEALRKGWEAHQLLGPTDDPVAMTRKLLYEPTCNICGLYSGYSGPGSKTILPARAGAKLDFRLVPDQNPDKILVQLRKYLRDQGFDDVEVEETEQGEFPAQSPVDTPLMEAAQRAVRRVYGREPRMLPRAAGTGPVEQLCMRYGIPIVNGAGVGNANSRVHSPNENVSLDDYMLHIKLAATLLAEFAS